MIIGSDFVWLHFPKTAGSSLDAALRELIGGRPGVVFDDLDDQSGVWHHTVSQRMTADADFDPSGKRVFCGIRRLPAWVMSRVQFEAERSGKVATREMIERGEFFEPDGAAWPADVYMQMYAPDVTDWIRTESLADDVAAAFSIDLAVVKEVIATHRKRETRYVKDTSFWFTADQIERLYDANPIWAKVEREVYGSLSSSG